MKRKININRPTISSEEIAKRKNFDSVLKHKPQVSAKPLLKKPWFLSSVIVATVAVVATVVLMKMNTTPKDVTLSGVEGQQPTTNVESPISNIQHPTINPPLAGVNVPYTIFKVKAEKGADLDFKTGSKLNVPKNAFVDANGSPVKGEVELRYREFHEPVEFFVSGIPMTYDSAGTRYQFESAGMMEMLAYQDGKQVAMADGKSINVELASDYKGTEYNLYKLDTVHNNWSCLGKDKVQAVKPVDPIREVQVTTVDKTPEYKQIETKKVEVLQEKQTQIAALPKPALEPKKPVKANKEKYTEGLEVDYKEFPELNQFKGVLWEVADEQTHKNVNAVTWEDAKIKEGPKKGENYIITLSKGQKKYDIVVCPVLEGKNYETAAKDFQTKFDQYNVALDKRKADEKKIEDEYQAKLLALKKQQEALELKWKQQMESEFAGMDTEEKVKRTFAINSFGVYNCDNPSAYPRGVLCSANLTNDMNTKLLIYDAFLVDKEKNGLFTFSKNPITQFSFNPASKNLLWTVENGVLYYLKPEQFSELKSSEGLRDLKLNRVDQKFKSTDEMKAFFNL